jgi:NADH-quinone oxidoreductase subunit H
MDFVYSKLVGSFGEVTGHNIATALGTITLFLKIFFFIFLFMWIRWTLPRFRYDQLMNLAWKWMMPVAVVNLIITAAAELSGKPLLYNWIGLAIFAATYFGLFPIFKKKTVSAN